MQHNQLTNDFDGANGLDYEEEYDSKYSKAKFATRAIHAGQDAKQWTSRAVIPPISMATTFEQYSPANFAVSEFFIFHF